MTLLGVERPAAALTDLLIVTAMTGALANRIRPLWWLVAAQVVGVLAVGAWPEHVRVIGNATAVVSIVAIGIALRLAGRGTDRRG